MSPAPCPEKWGFLKSCLASPVPPCRCLPCLAVPCLRPRVPLPLPCCYPCSLLGLPVPYPCSARVCPSLSSTAVLAVMPVALGFCLLCLLFLLGHPFAFALCSACLSLSARLLVFVDSPMSVASNGEGQRKQASEQRDKQSKAQTQRGNRARTSRQSEQKPKATGRTASTAVEDKAGQTRAEQGSGTGRPSREQG